MSRKTLVVSFAVAGGLAVVVMSELERQRVYDYGVSDFLDHDVREQRVRVHGTLVPGTLCRVGETCGYRFAIAEPTPTPSPSYLPGAPILPINFEGCVMPETFLERPSQMHDVYVSGERCRSCHEFEATNILTRTDSLSRMGAETANELPPKCDASTPRM
jgi:cytochrome c-type biogenesis protein CcmE